jgi:hypothetical protein
MINLSTPQSYGILHNRKTGGTALKQIIHLHQKINPSATHIMCFGHEMNFPTFIKTYPHAQAIFFIREPISRFISGFYSRLRQGRPHYDYPWKKAEKKAFTRFDTPNKLAEALSANNLITRYYAKQAMKSIGHIKHTYLDFFGPVSFLEKNSDKIAFIGHQPELNKDYIHLQNLLNLSKDLQLPEDEVSMHRNPAILDKNLSPTAIANLQKWYQHDFAIYAWCIEEREKMV